MCASSLTGPQKYKADRRSPEAPNWLPGPMIASGCCVRDFGVFRCISEGGSKKDHKLSTPRFTMDRPEDREYSYCIHDREKLHQPASPEPDSRGQVARRRAKNRERLTLTASHYSQSLQSHTHHRHSTEWQWGGAGAVMTHEACGAACPPVRSGRFGTPSCGTPSWHAPSLVRVIVRNDALALLLGRLPRRDEVGPRAAAARFDGPRRICRGN
jgi:hypothetical protein